MAVKQLSTLSVYMYYEGISAYQLHTSFLFNRCFSSPPSPLPSPLLPPMHLPLSLKVRHDWQQYKWRQRSGGDWERNVSWPSTGQIQVPAHLNLVCITNQFLNVCMCYVTLCYTSSPHVDFMLIPVLVIVVIYREIMTAPVNLLCCKITIIICESDVSIRYLG